MKTKSLSREQRQVRYIPLFITVVIALVYGIIHINTGGPFLQESLPGWWTFRWEMSRYFDIPMLYLASLIFVMLCQKDGGADLSETVFVNIALVFIAAFIAWVFSLSLLSTIIMMLGVTWGLAYSSAKEIGVNMLMLFVVLTLIFGFINAFIICAATLALIGMTASIRLLMRGKDFRKFTFWIGLAPAREYKVNDPSIVEAKRSVTTIDLSVAPEEVSGFTIKSHKPGPKDFVFNLDELSLYLSFIQKKQGGAQGIQIIKDPIIQHKSFNAVLLDWLLKNPEEIPEEWKKIEIPFWDTTYERNGIEHVRSLVWSGNQFASEIRWLTRYFGEDYQTLVTR